MPTICLIRAVNESHSAATKKNREWQEKLPTVVLKAEEIMYSKANSEVYLLHFAYTSYYFSSLALEGLGFVPCIDIA